MIKKPRVPLDPFIMVFTCGTLAGAYRGPKGLAAET